MKLLILGVVALVILAFGGVTCIADSDSSWRWRQEARQQVMEAREKAREVRQEAREARQLAREHAREERNRIREQIRDLRRDWRYTY
jgi:uncharacterized protein (DUF3084 family)